jgi:hypothetical protein
VNPDHSSKGLKMTTFEFKVNRYTVNMDWSNDIRDFRAIELEGEGLPWARLGGVLYFFEGHRPDDVDAKPPIGAFRVAERRIIATLNLPDFDSIYAILRSERPVFVRGSRTGELIDFLEIHSNSEPVGEVDATPAQIVVGTGDVVGDIDGVGLAPR